MMCSRGNGRSIGVATVRWKAMRVERSNWRYAARAMLEWLEFGCSSLSSKPPLRHGRVRRVSDQFVVIHGDAII